MLSDRYYEAVGSKGEDEHDTGKPCKQDGRVEEKCEPVGEYKKAEPSIHATVLNAEQAFRSSGT